MKIDALAVYLGNQRVGTLVRTTVAVHDDTAHAEDLGLEHRFVFAGSNLSTRPGARLSICEQVSRAERGDEITAEKLWSGRYSKRNGWLLPAFFQNLLPEGEARAMLALARGCSVRDHFELLAACGEDLPGNVVVRPAELTSAEIKALGDVLPDTFEGSRVAPALPRAFSLCGVQAKVSVVRSGSIFVQHVDGSDTDIIAKLPVQSRPYLALVEHLSMRLAHAAGVSVCETRTVPLVRLEPWHKFDLGTTDESDVFLAVKRYDRVNGVRVHCEDFAQVLGVMPEEKYGWCRSSTERVTYLDVARVFMRYASLGEEAVHELLRRLAVNEMLGNVDMHLKNIGLWYPDGSTPQLPPAYDIVGYSAYGRNAGHALMIVPPALYPYKVSSTDSSAALRQSLSPATVKVFCKALGIPDGPVVAAIAACVRKAHDEWPAMIQQSTLPPIMRERLLQQFWSHPMIASLVHRRLGRAARVTLGGDGSPTQVGASYPALDVWGDEIRQ